MFWNSLCHLLLYVYTPVLYFVQSGTISMIVKLTRTLRSRYDTILIIAMVIHITKLNVILHGWDDGS